MAEVSDSRYSLIEFMHDFPNDAACLEILVAGAAAVGRVAVQRLLSECEHERKPHIGRGRRGRAMLVRAPSAPDGRDDLPQSSTSLRSWFYAMYLMTSTRCGISAKQLERELGVTYKTAWRMFNKIRNELMDRRRQAAAGKVEVDETGVHGSPRATAR